MKKPINAAAPAATPPPAESAVTPLSAPPVARSTPTALQRRTAENDERVRRGRELLPQATERLDYLRQFFPEAKLTYAIEGRNRFGEPSPEGVVPVLQTRVEVKESKAAEKAMAKSRQRELIA